MKDQTLSRNRLLKTFLLLFTLLFTGSLIPAQVSYQKRYYGEDQDYNWDLSPAGNNFYMVGYTARTAANGRDQGYIIRTDREGRTQWIRTLGTAGDDQLRSCIGLADGSVILSGHIQVGLNRPSMIARVDSNGTLQWGNAVDATGNGYNTRIARLTGGDFVGLASTNPPGSLARLLVYRFDEFGNVHWSKNIYIPNINLEGRHPLATSDGGALLPGGIGFIGEGMLTKIDSAGNVEWINEYNFTGDAVFSHAVEIPGGYLTIGTLGNGNLFQILMAKVDKTGALRWSKVFYANGRTAQFELERLGPNEFLIGGYTDQGDVRSMIVSVDSSGNQLWGKVYGESGPAQSITAIVPHSDGGYLTSGSWDRTTSPGRLDPTLMKLDSLAETPCDFQPVTLSDSAKTMTWMSVTSYLEDTADGATTPTSPLSMGSISYEETANCSNCSFDGAIGITGNFCTNDSLTVLDLSPGAVGSIWSVNGQEAAAGSPATVGTLNSISLNLSLLTFDGVCLDTLDSLVNLAPMPNANFNFADTGLTVTFTDASVGNIAAWDWDFDGQGSSTQQNPVFTFSTGGDYTVCLTVVSVDGCVNERCQQVRGLVGREEAWEPESLLLFPNPAVEEVFLSGVKGPLTISLLDLTGKVLTSKRVIADDRHPVRYPLDQIPEGLYLLEVKQGEHRTDLKLKIGR